MADFRSSIADILLENKLKRLLAAMLYSNSQAQYKNRATQYDELLATASDRVRERVNKEIK